MTVIISTETDRSRRRILLATGTVFAGTTTGCLGGIETAVQGTRDTGRTAGEAGSGRCYAEARSHFDGEYATVENVGALNGEVLVSLDRVADEVATGRVFRDDTTVGTFDVQDGSRFEWAAPDVPFETTYRLVLRNESEERLDTFEFAADCSVE